VAATVNTAGVDTAFRPEINPCI